MNLVSGNADKGKVVSVHAIKTYGAMEVQLHCTITSALHVSGDLHAHSRLPIRETALAAIGKGDYRSLKEPLQKTRVGKM
jgi:hypothetical protein